MTGIGTPAPFPFLRLADNASPEDAVGAIKLLQDIYVEREQDRPDRHSIVTFVRRLSVLGRVLHVAVMSTRGTSDIRIHLGTNPARLLDGLVSVGWPGDRTAVADLVRLWEMGTRPVGIQLQIGEKVRPHLDIEYFRDTPGGCDESFRRFIRRLVDRGLMDRLDAEAVDCWAAPDDLPGYTDVRVFRWLQLKIGLRETGEYRVKAYLGFSPRPR